MIDNNPGLLIEKLNAVRTSSATWTIIQKINLQPYFYRGYRLLDIWRIISNHCSAPGITCLYKQQLNTLGERIQDTIHDTEGIAETLQGQKIKMQRPKRAWFSGIGKVSRMIFGTLDEEAGEELKKLIESSANDTRKLANLLANQTELITTELGITQGKLTQLETKLENIENGQQTAEKMEMLAAAVELFTENVLQFEIDTEMLTDAILFATQGIIHPKLMPPEQLEKSAELVRNSIAPLEFPTADKQHSIGELTRISKLTVLFSNFNLVYHLAIPLLDHTIYDLCRAVPLPILQENFNITPTFAYIWPNDKYFAVNTQKDTYIQFTQDDINKCKMMGSTYVCANTQPIHKVTRQSACEILLFTRHNIDDLSQCKIKVIKLHETYWTRLLTANTWLFSTKNEEQLFISCKQAFDHQILLRNTGLLTLPSGCVAQTNTIRLVASREFKENSSINTLNVTTLDITKFFNNNDKEHVEAIHKLINETESDKGSMRNGGIMSHALHNGQNFKDIINKARSLGEYKTVSYKVENMQTALTYSSIVIIVIGIIAAVLCRCSALGGSLVLICSRMFSANNTPPHQEPVIKYIRSEPQITARQMRQLQNTQPQIRMAESVSNLSQLAATSNIQLRRAVLETQSMDSLDQI